MVAVEVPQTLKYKGGQLNAIPILEVENFTNWKKRFMCHILDDQMNSVINYLTDKSTWDDLILYHEGPSDVKESRYKALINELVNDVIKLSKLEINVGFINGLPKKWLSFCQSLRNTNHVKDSELASLFGKLKYEENLIESTYETEKSKSLISTTSLSTSFISTSIFQDFQDSLDDEEDTKSSHKYLNDLEEEYQARALLAKSKRFFKKADDTKVSIPGVERPWLSEAEVDESSVCSTLLPLLKKLDGAEPISGPKTIKSILRLKSAFKAETLKGVIINKPSSAPAKGNKSSLALKANSALAGKLKSVKIKDDPPLAICDIRKPIWYLDSRCSRHMTGIKSYLHKYAKHLRPNVVFGDDSTCTTDGHGSIKCNGIVFTKVAFVNGLNYNLISISQLYDAKYIVQFNEKRGTIFNSNKEVVMIDPRVSDVYVLDMTSSTHESCFFEKASENLNWLWHKRLAHLNFKTINQLDYLGKFDEKANDGYLLGNSLVSKAFRVFNTRRQKTEETYHVTFDESPDVIKFSKPSVENINIAENERYPYGQTDQNDQSVQNDEILKAGMLTRAMAQELGTASAYECLFIDFLSEEEPKKYPKCLGFDLKGYSDSHYVGCNMDTKSTLGACQLLGGKLAYWSAKKPPYVAMSLAKAEYVAAAGCCANILWMKSQLTDYDIIYEKVPIFCDNTSAIAISNNTILHSRTKHIDIIYHFIRDHILKGDIELHFIPTKYQLADIFTKPLDEPTFKRLIVEPGGIRGDIEKETQSISAKDKIPSHPSHPTPMVGEMHKEAQQAVGGPTSLGATSEEGAHPQLSSDSTTKANLGNSAPNDSIPLQQDTRSAFFTPDSVQDELIIVSDKSKEEEEVDKD
nr:retrovirus-related Pol polyprotein from transposon TNT 1-94 [Tanacetum cinerariifolium]